MDPVTQYSNDDTSFLGYTPHFQPTLAPTQPSVLTSTSNHGYPTEVQAYANTHSSQFQPQANQRQYQRTSRIFSEPVLPYDDQSSSHMPQATPSRHWRTCSLGENPRYFGGFVDEQTPALPSYSLGFSRTEYCETFGMDLPSSHYLMSRNQGRHHCSSSQLQNAPFDQLNNFSHETPGGHQEAYYPTGSTMQESNQQFEGPAEISYQSNSLGVIPENQTMGPENIAYMYSVPPNDSADDLATWTVMHALQEHTQLSDAQTASIHASNSALPLYAQSHSEINAPYYHLPNVEPRQTAESSESPVLNRTQTPSSGYNYHRTTSRATLGAGAFYSDQQAQVAYKDVGVQTEPERSLSERGHVVKKAGRGEVTRAATTRNERSKRVLAVPTSLNRLPPAPRDGSQTRENLRLVQPTLYPRTGSGSRPPYPSSNHQGPSADITLEVPLSDSHHAPQSFGLTHHPAPQNGQDHQILTGLGRIPQSLPPVTRDHAPPRTAPQAPSIATPTPCNLLVHPLQQTQVPLSPYTPDDFIRQTLDGLTPAPRESTSPVSNEQTPYLSCRHDSGTSHLAPGRSISIGHLPTPNPTPDGSLDKRLCYPPSPLGDMGTTQASIPGAPEASNQYHIESSATRQEGAQLQEGTYDHVVVPCILVNGASDTAPSLGGMSGQNRVQPGSSSERVQSRFQESSSSGTMHRPTQPLQSGVQGHLSLTNYRSTAQPQQQSRLQYNPSTQTVQSYAKSKQQSTSTVLQSNIPKAGQIYPERAERGEQYQTQALRFKRERSSCETSPGQQTKRQRASSLGEMRGSGGSVPEPVPQAASTNSPVFDANAWRNSDPAQTTSTPEKSSAPGLDSISNILN